MPLLLTANGPPLWAALGVLWPPAAWCANLPTVPPVALDTRLAVYLALAQAAPCAVKVVDLWGAGLKDVHEAVRDLQAVGHGITQLRIGEAKDPRTGQPPWGWRLDRDAWGGRPPATFPAQEALVV